MTGFGLFTFGVISTLPMGPAGLNVAASAIRKQSFPLRAFFGLLSAEATYLLVAFIIKDMMLSQIFIWKSITYVVAGIFVLFYGISLTHKNKKQMTLPLPSGFKKSFLITASNPGILLLHLTVLLQVESFQPITQAKLVFSFLMGGILTILAIVMLLLHKKEFFSQHGQKIENRCGYLLILMSFFILKKAIENIFLI